MESKTKNRKTREQVARMVERAFGGTALATGEDAVSELEEGWFNAAYTVRLSDGNKSGAARLLGLHRKAVSRRL